MQHAVGVKFHRDIVVVVVNIAIAHRIPSVGFLACFWDRLPTIDRPHGPLVLRPDHASGMSTDSIPGHLAGGGLLGVENGRGKVQAVELAVGRAALRGVKQVHYFLSRWWKAVMNEAALFV